MSVKFNKHFKSLRLNQLTKFEHSLLVETGLLNNFYPEACGIYEDDVGTKVKDEDQGWPYEMGDSYISKVTNVTQAHLDAYVGDFKKGDKDE